MAHFAKLDANNVVEKVIVVANEDTADSAGVETESIGVAFCQKLLGASTNWKQTSYNGNFRGNYAGIGYTYDAENDVFIAPKPFSKWVLDETKWVWKAPTDYPDDGKSYTWNDNKGEWEEVTE